MNDTAKPYTKTESSSQTMKISRKHYTTLGLKLIILIINFYLVIFLMQQIKHPSMLPGINKILGIAPHVSPRRARIQKSSLKKNQHMPLQTNEP